MFFLHWGDFLTRYQSLKDISATTGTRTPDQKHCGALIPVLLTSLRHGTPFPNSDYPQMREMKVVKATKLISMGDFGTLCGSKLTRSISIVYEALSNRTYQGQYVVLSGISAAT